MLRGPLGIHSNHPNLKNVGKSHEIWVISGWNWTLAELRLNFSRKLLILFIPLCSMYGIFTYMTGWFFRANAGKYSIHGASGIYAGLNNCFYPRSSSTLKGVSITNHPAIGVHKNGNPRSQVFSPRKCQLPGDAEKKGAAEKLLRFRDLINETAREPSSSKRDVNVEPRSSQRRSFLVIKIEILEILQNPPFKYPFIVIDEWYRWFSHSNLHL